MTLKHYLFHAKNRKTTFCKTSGKCKTIFFLTKNFLEFIKMNMFVLKSSSPVRNNKKSSNYYLCF